MTRIAIVCQSLVPGDAVGNDVLEMHRVLSRRGYDVALFAGHWELPEPACRPVSEVPAFLRGNRSNVLIYHHSTGFEAGVALLACLSCKRIVRYHNVTPAAFLEGISQALAAPCRQGREQLQVLARAQCALYLSDSVYNERELVAEGADAGRCTVLPPFHHIDRLPGLPPDAGVLSACRDGRTNVLFVGRVAPHKGHAALLEAFAVYHWLYDRNSRLLLVGKEDPRLEYFNAFLREQARRLGVQGAVTFTGEVSDQCLKAYFQAADVFVSASEHEGFCVPLVEAMALRLPIVAHGCSAVPDTVGPAGLLWDAPDPFLLAESIACVVNEPSVRAALEERGWQRYQERFHSQRIEGRFLDAVECVLSA
jgi:glycosyltransferase involved in cell wall biosynthesis